MRDIELVKSYQEARDNVVQFYKDLKHDSGLLKNLSRYRNWYYFPQLDMFGPSKFIGYRQMNAALYQVLQQVENNKQLKGRLVDSRKTARVLSRWFKKVEEEKYRERLHEKLSCTLELYGKRPNKRCNIFLPR